MELSEQESVKRKLMDGFHSVRHKGISGIPSEILDYKCVTIYEEEKAGSK